MNEDKLQRDIMLGTQAKFLLENELLKACFIMLREDAVEALETASMDEVIERVCELKAIDKLKSKLNALLQNGRIAQHKLLA